VSLTTTFLPPKEFVRSAEARSRVPSLAEAEAYTRWLAGSHYENFPVASILLPRRLRQDFYNLYAYCRWADDLGDEIGDSAESERLLEWWGGELEAMYAGRATHPVFIALQKSRERHELPIGPFRDLIRAFIQDQRKTRYPTREELLDYCRYSANPVGRLVLAVCGYTDPERHRLSDATCTALQLANFWQDVSVDLEKGRLYVPLEDLRQSGCAVEDVHARRASPAFRKVVRELVGWARRLFEEGLPLTKMVDRRLALDVELFSRGGMKILDKIEALDYDVLTLRPSISHREQAWLLLSAVGRAVFSRAA